MDFFDTYHPGLSVDCVIFGFHDEKLKVLLLKMKNMGEWAIPGGFVKKDEPVDTAAKRVLHERTGLSNIYLNQFWLFGNLQRHDQSHVDQLINDNVIPTELEQWFRQRFVSLGYFALVEFSEVTPTPDSISEKCEWVSLDNLPNLILDHSQIINKGLNALRDKLRFQPIGKNLLPEKFTMKELRTLYETILGEELDRRNFQRKMLNFDILDRLNEKRTGGAHRAPWLYSFNDKKYNQKIDEGLNTLW